MEQVWVALGLTIFAGMATGIGSVIAFFVKRTNYRFLSISTGFSAGVMLYVSFVEIFFKGADALTRAYGPYLSGWINAASFFGGIVFIGLIDSLIPSGKNPHETHTAKEISPLADTSVSVQAFNAAFDSHHAREHKKLMRMGIFTAIAIAIHNFPEGMATFFAAIEDPNIGIAIAVAVALHNIPEGISVSVPIFYAIGDRNKAFVYSLLSGLAEPLGAAIAYLSLLLFTGSDAGVVGPEIMGILFGGVAGIMVYISIDELLPTSRAFGKGHDSIIGLVAGMAVMALSLLIMKKN